MTQVGHIAYQYMRLDETNTLISHPRLYLDSVRSYWCKCFCDLQWRHAWWRHMTCTGVTGRQLHLVHWRIRLNRHGHLHLSWMSKNNWKDPQEWTFASSGPWHDLENKVIAQQRKIIKSRHLQTLCKKIRSKLREKSETYRKKRSVQPRKLSGG